MTSVEPVRAQRISWHNRAPSPPWYGALVIISLALMAAILLTYPLVNWRWQQSLGVINYAAVIGLIPVVAVLMRCWQPDRTG